MDDTTGPADALADAIAMSMSDEDPGDADCPVPDCGVAHCAGCGRHGQPYEYKGQVYDGLTPCEGNQFCPACRDSYLYDRTAGRRRVDPDGNDAGLESDYITPMAWGSVPHKLKRTLRTRRRAAP